MSAFLHKAVDHAHRRYLVIQGQLGAEPARRSRLHDHRIRWIGGHLLDAAASSSAPRTSDVAARPVETLDEICFDWIPGERHNDGSPVRRALRRLRWRRIPAHDHIHIAAHQLGCQSRQVACIALVDRNS
jgi:hypothetical protein